MKLFWGFARQAFAALAMYRLEFWMQILGNFALMYGAYWLWNTLYIRQPQYFTVSLGQMLTYGMLAMTMDTLFRATTWVRYYIADQVRTGAIQMDLLRPLDFQFHLLARSSGEMLLSLATLGIPGYLTGALFLGLRPPSSIINGLFFLISLVLAYLVAFSLNFIVGVAAVYSTGAQRISWVYYSVQRFFSGQMVPLWIFPPLLVQVANLLPFQSLVGIPLSIYIGRLSLGEAGQAMLIQVFWVMALLVLSRLIWQHAHTRLTVQGG